MKKKTVLIIGSKGNIGKKLTLSLKKKGKYKVLESDIRPAWSKNYFMADINNPIDLVKAFEKKPICVFLLSAIVSRVTSEQAKSLTINTNLAGLNNVVQLCKKYNSKLIFFSTSEIYGNHKKIMSEDDPNPEPNNFYGLSKFLGEKIIEYEVKHFNLKAVILRPFMIYDEEEVIGEHRSAMIRFATNLFKNKKIEVHKDSKRGWFHISDAIKAIENASLLKNFKIINIGNPNIISTAVLAEMIRKEFRASKKLISYKKLPRRMTLAKKPKLTNQKRLLKIVPKINVKEGVKLVCNSIRERLKNTN